MLISSLNAIKIRRDGKTPMLLSHREEEEEGVGIGAKKDKGDSNRDEDEENMSLKGKLIRSPSLVDLADGAKRSR